MKTIINVVASVDPPWVNECFTDYPNSCEYPGVEIFILYQQLVALGYGVNLSLASGPVEMFEMLKNNSADITGITYSLDKTSLYSNFVTPTLPVTDDKTIFVVREPSQFGVGPDLIFEYCTWSLWLLILLSFVFVLLYKHVHRFIDAKLGNTYSKFAAKFPYIAFGLVLTVVLSCYSQYLAIAFTIKLPPSLPFEDLKSLTSSLKNGVCKLVLRERDLDEMIRSYFPQSFDGFDEFIDAVNVSGFQTFTNESEWVDVITSSECNVGFIYRNDKPVYISKFHNLAYVEDPAMPVFHYVYHFRSNHPEKSMLAFLNIVTGDDYYKRYIVKVSIANSYVHLHHNDTVDSEIDPGLKPLNVNQLVSCFYLLAIGAVVSGLVYVVHLLIIIVGRKRKRSFDFTV